MASFSWLSLLSIAFFFIFTAFFFLVYFIAFAYRMKPFCRCEICQNFITSSWSMEFNNLCDWYSHLLSKSPTGTIHVHALNNVITANPENVEYILKTRFENYPKGKQFQEILGDLLGRGIFNVDGDLWKFQRKMAIMELGSVSVRSYAFDIVTSEIQSRLIPCLSAFARNSSFVDLQDVFRRFSFDSICRFSFGLDPGCLNLSSPVSDFASAFDLASKLSAQRAICVSPWIWKIKRIFRLGSEKELREAMKMVNSFAGEMIESKRKMGFSPDKDLLSRFMSTVDDGEFLRDIVVSFLLAGRDTVASGLTTFFWLLSKNPEAIAAIRAESDKVMGTETRKPVSFQQLKQMQYYQASVHESLRLFPPVQFDSKFCQEDDVLPDGTFVPKNCRVTYHPYAMGRMERIWGEDCLEFRPERWLKDGYFVQKNPIKFPVFQAGPRVCLGREIAVVEISTVALSLIRRFDVEVVTPRHAPVFVPGLTATVKGGLQVGVRERIL